MTVIDQIAALRGQELRLLAAIAEHSPLTISDAASLIGISPTAATRSIQRLVDSGYVHRAESDDDRRAKVLRALPAGAALVARLSPAATAKDTTSP